MTKRILMRLGKTPFELADPYRTLDRNLLGTNSGNLIYGAAAHKLFSTEGTVVEANHYAINGVMADRVNDEYDAFVLPLANCFRPDFEDQLRRTADFLERLRIPFLMLSGGAQLPLDGDTSSLKAMEPTIKRFARAVLDGSSALSVRGEMTADYLNSLGFKDVVVVGCPSLALHGPGHSVDVPGTLGRGAPIAYNLETKDPFAAALVADAEQHYRATYIPQEHGTLEMLLWSTDPYESNDPRLPLTRRHPQFAGERAEFFIDAHPWIARLSQMAFSFGARAHGNIAAALAGTPSVILAHDSRTLELARHHGIPHVVRGEGTMPSSVEQLYQQADFTEFNRGHAERFGILSDFIHDSGFRHIYDADQEHARLRYEQRIAELEPPRAVRPAWSEDPLRAHQRNAALHDRETRRKQGQAALRRDIAKKHAQIARESAQLASRLDRLEEDLAAAERRADAAETRAKALEKRLAAVARQAGDAHHRAERAVRIPTWLRDAVGRSGREH